MFYLHSRLLERAAKLNDANGRRLADGAADHRDAGRRPLGLHPDQRHLDHRRPDLPRERPVPPGRPPGHQRRQLGVARRRLGADQGDAPGRRHAAPRPRRSTASWRRSRSSAATSTRSTQQQLQSRRPPGRGPQAAAVLSRCRWRSRSSIIYAGTNGYSMPCRSPTSASTRRARTASSTTQRPGILQAIAEKKDTRRRAQGRAEASADGVREGLRRRRSATVA